MTAMAPPRPRWRATAPDGIAHAFASRTALRALCGALNSEERYDWPVREHCPVCTARGVRGRS